MGDMYDPAFPTCDEDSGETPNVHKAESASELVSKKETKSSCKEEDIFSEAMHVVLEEEKVDTDNSEKIKPSIVDRIDCTLLSEPDLDINQVKSSHDLVKTISDTDIVRSENNNGNEQEQVDFNIIPEYNLPDLHVELKVSQQVTSLEADIQDKLECNGPDSELSEKICTEIDPTPVQHEKDKPLDVSENQPKTLTENLVSGPNFSEPFNSKSFMVAGSIPVNRDHSYSRKLKLGSAEKVDIVCAVELHREDSNDSIGSNSGSNISSHSPLKKQKEKCRKLVSETKLHLYDLTPVSNKGIVVASEQKNTCSTIMEDVVILKTSVSIEAPMQVDEPADYQKEITEIMDEIPSKDDEPASDEVTPSELIETKVTTEEISEIQEREDSEQKSPKDSSNKKKARRSSSKACDQSSSSSTDDVPVRRSSRIRSIEEKKGKEKVTKPKKERAPKNTKQDVKKKIDVKSEKSESPLVEEPERLESKVLDSPQEETKTILSFKNDNRDDSSNGDTNSVASNDSSAVSIPLVDTKVLSSPMCDVKREEDCTMRPEKVKSRWRRSSELETVYTNVIPAASHMSLPPLLEDNQTLISQLPPPPPPLRPVLAIQVKKELSIFTLPSVSPTPSLLEEIPLPPPLTVSEPCNFLPVPISSFVKSVPTSLPAKSLPSPVNTIPLPIPLSTIPVPNAVKPSLIALKPTAVPISNSVPVPIPLSSVPVTINSIPVPAKINSVPVLTTINPIQIPATINQLPETNHIDPVTINPVPLPATINPVPLPGTINPVPLPATINSTVLVPSTINLVPVPESINLVPVPGAINSLSVPATIKSIVVPISSPQPQLKLPSVLPEPDVRPHPFELIGDNIYLFDRRRSKSKKEVRRMQCDCTLTKEEREQNVSGCTQDCLNRLLMIECGSRCLLGDACSNKRFQKKEQAKTQPFRTEKKGWGLQTMEDLVSGSFVMEYVGEVLSPVDFKQRVKHYARGKNDHYYFMALKGDEIIDATLKGNLSRFINHSCDPNCETQKWTVNGELRIGFFTTRDVKVDDELTFDYQFQRYGREAQRCYCDSDKCRGFIGGESRISLKSGKTYQQKKQRSRNTEERKSEDLFLEQEIEKLNGGLRNQEQTLTLARLMVRAEDHDTRQRLLDIIQSTTEQACLRLFLDYHGLPLLWSWMVDIGDHSAQLKSQILQILSILPISNKTMLLDSKVINVVQRWAAQTQTLPACSPSVKSDSSTPESIEQTLPTPLPITISAAPTIPAVSTTSGTSTTEDVPSQEVTIINSENFIIDDLDSIPLPPMPPPPARKPPKSSTGEGSDTEAIKVENPPALCASAVASDTPSDSDSSKDAILLPIADSAELRERTPELPSEGKVNENGLPKSDSDESHDTVEEEDGNKNDVSNLAAKILEAWTGLKEVFRIPRLEQEKRKEDERAAAQQQQFLDGNWEGSPPRHNKLDSSPSSRSRKRNNKDSEGDWNGRSNLRSPLLPTPPKMSKAERRQLFAMEVQQRDHEEAMRRHHEEIMTVTPLMEYHSAPIPFPYDPSLGYHPVAYDPNTGFPLQTDPNAGFQLQTDPNTGFPLQTNPGFPVQTDPNTGFPLQTDPNTGFPIQINPNPGYSIQTDPNTGYQIQTDPNTGYPIQTDPNIGYTIQTDPNTGYPIREANPGYSIPPPNIDPNTGFHIQATIVDPNTGYPTSIPVVNTSTYPVQSSTVDHNAGYGLHTVSSSSSMVVLPQESHLSSTSITSTTVHPGYPPDSHQPLIYQQAPIFQPPSQVSYLPVTSHMVAPSSTESPIAANLVAPVAAFIPPSASPSLAVGSPVVTSSPSLLPTPKQVHHPVLSPLATIPAPAGIKFVPPPNPQPFLATTTQGATQLYYVQSTGAVVPIPPDQTMAAAAPSPLVHVAVEPPTTEDHPAPPPTPPKPPAKLPPNWKSAKDEEGNLYYYHSVTRETQWDPPSIEEDDDDNESMDLGTPTFDEPKMGIRIKHHASSSSSSSSCSSKKKTTTAAADTSSEVAKKIKELFRSKMSGYIVQCLNPYRKPDCKLGRITNTEDFKHLARKLTHFVMSKEIKYCKNVEDLECNENVKHKAKDFVSKYMSKYGSEYRKDKHGSPR